MELRKMLKLVSCPYYLSVGGEEIGQFNCEYRGEPDENLMGYEVVEVIPCSSECLTIQIEEAPKTTILDMVDKETGKVYYSRVMRLTNPTESQLRTAKNNVISDRLLGFTSSLKSPEELRWMSQHNYYEREEIIKAWKKEAKKRVRWEIRKENLE